MNITIQNSDIMLVVAGIVVVLIGLIGGGIEIGGAKIPSIINKSQKVAISSFGILLLLWGIILNLNTPLSSFFPFNFVTTPAPTLKAIPTPTVTAVTNCPSAATVANLMNLPQGTVQQGVQNCDFHSTTYTTQAHCPDGYGPVIVQLTPNKQNDTMYIECSGTTPLPAMLGAEIFFQTWNATDICDAAKDYKKDYPQTVVEAPARCGVSN